MRTLFQALVVVVASVVVAVAYNLFFMPHQMVSGGVAGLALLVGQVLGWPVGLQVMLYNIPILWFAWRSLGQKFLWLTILGIGSMTVVVTLLPVEPVLTDEPMLNAIFGGIVCGAGVGLAMRVGGSLGGLDVAMVAAHKRWSLPMGDFMMGCNALIVALAGLRGDLKPVLYTLVAMFFTGKMIDLVTAGTVKKTVLIVTAAPDLMVERIKLNLGRGVTMLDGKGAYTGEGRSVLLCVVTRYELSQMKEMIEAADSNAFMTVLDTDQVMGRFNPYHPLMKVTKTIA